MPQSLQSSTQSPERLGYASTLRERTRNCRELKIPPRLNNAMLVKILLFKQPPVPKPPSFQIALLLAERSILIPFSTLILLPRDRVVSAVRAKSSLTNVRTSRWSVAAARCIALGHAIVCPVGRGGGRSFEKTFPPWSCRADHAPGPSWPALVAAYDFQRLFGFGLYQTQSQTESIDPPARHFLGFLLSYFSTGNHREHRGGIAHNVDK